AALHLAVLAARDQPGLPKSQRGVLLERGHRAQIAVVLERRVSPLHGFHDLGAGLVHDRADVAEDRLGRVCRLCDVGVDAWVLGRHGGAPVRAKVRCEPVRIACGTPPGYSSWRARKLTVPRAATIT